METDVCVWRYAPLVVLATQEEKEYSIVISNSIVKLWSILYNLKIQWDTGSKLQIPPILHALTHSHLVGMKQHLAQSNYDGSLNLLSCMKGWRYVQSFLHKLPCDRRARAYRLSEQCQQMNIHFTINTYTKRCQHARLVAGQDKNRQHSLSPQIFTRCPGSIFTRMMLPTFFTYYYK